MKRRELFWECICQAQIIHSFSQKKPKHSVVFGETLIANREAAPFAYNDIKKSFKDNKPI